MIEHPGDPPGVLRVGGRLRTQKITQRQGLVGVVSLADLVEVVDTAPIIVNAGLVYFAPNAIGRRSGFFGP
jgi:hypothetical protein